MNTQEIVESGVLESYLLGITSAEDQQAVKELIITSPQLTDHLVDIESDIQSHFTKNAVPPPAIVREILLLRNPVKDIVKHKHVFNKTSQETQPSQEKYLDIEVNDTHIKVHKYWRPAFIAVFVLSKIFLIGGLYYYFKSASLQQEIERLKTEINR